MEYAYQNSTIAQILEAIINESTFEGESNSNIGDILLSILNKTPYTEPPKSVIADLFLRVKAKIEGESFEPYEGDHISRIADILLSILNETEYTEEPQSRIAELLLELKEELEAYTELTASGSIASFITNVVKSLVNGEFSIVAYQEGSGDPSPVNVRNIIPFNAVNITHTHKNLISDTRDLIGQYLRDDGLPSGSSASWDTSPFYPIKENTTFYLSCKNPPTTSQVPRNCFYDKNKELISVVTALANRTLTAPANAAFIRLSLFHAAYDYQLEVGSQATDYEPYVTPEIKTKQLGEDVYGGSYNSVSGVKSKTWDIIDMGDMTWRFGVVDTTHPYGYWYSDSISNKKNGYTNILCDTFKVKNTYYEDNCIMGVGNSRRIYIVNSDNNNLTSTEFKTAMTGHYIAYELVEPIESNIGETPIETYDGSNNIFCDTGDTSVTYLYKGTPPETITRSLSKGGNENNDIMKEEIEEIETEDEIEKPIDEEVNENEK